MENPRKLMGYDDPEGILEEIFGETIGVDNVPDPDIEDAVDSWCKE